MQEPTNNLLPEQIKIPAVVPLDDPKPATLRDIFAKLGPRNSSVRRVVESLAARGIVYTTSAVYQVVQGRVKNSVIAEEFLNVAEAEFQHRRDLEARTQTLAS
ncbi:hypothetical protein [Hymenobacter baengnokdamensis]|uniref:hypothetical protein n=1 Tax=Hymenobacter baengnokdamensis TaxID=2615203 RepID=UPI001781E778|nr:hypothetical protein [Hymenobacter baengnokdamensis]